MPTILELFKGSTFDKAVQPDKDTVVEFETTGIRPRSAVELNNPLIYGNQAIRIATRSTSAVEQMKQATGGSETSGGLIGQGLSLITAGGLGQFVFGGQVSSLNQARDGINSRLGISQLTIPTFVNNTGELQRNIEPDTMITIARIKNDAAGTLLGQFLKQSGGGNPQTIGRQLLGQGISLVKDKLREQLFGNPASMGSNTAQPHNTGWEYSSKSTYSDQIRDVKLQEPSTDNLAVVDNVTNETLKKTTELKQEAKRKLGDPGASLKNKLKGTSNTETLDAAIESQTQNPIPSSELKYSETLGNYKVDFREANTPIIDLSLVSPVYGVERKDSNGRYGKTEYGFNDVRNNTGVFSSYNPTEGNKYNDVNKNNLKTLYGLENGYDVITSTPISTKTDDELANIEKQDLIPFWVKEQRSGQIANFRSYITGLSETISPSWSSSKFFGNPFSFYTYDGVERSVQFSLKIVCFNKTELAFNWEKLEFLTRQTYPTFSGTPLFTNPPIISFRLGDMYRNKIGFFESLSYSFPETSPWETNIDGLLLPKYIDATITIKFIEQIGSESSIYNIKKSKDAIQLINENNANQGGSFTTNSITTTEQQPKVDEYGVVVDSGTEGGINKSQKNIETSKKEPTPKEKESGVIITPTNTVSAVSTEFNTRLQKVKQIIPNISDDVQRLIAKDVVLDLNTHKKISSNDIYSEFLKEIHYFTLDGLSGKQDWYINIGGNGYSGGAWRFFVMHENKGYDPLGIISYAKGSPPLIPSQDIPPINGDQKRRRKKR